MGIISPSLIQTTMPFWEVAQDAKHSFLKSLRRPRKVSCEKSRPVHHVCRLQGGFLTWSAAAARLVSLGISPFCLRVCAVMATAVWQVLGRREGWAVGKRPGFYKEDGRRARERARARAHEARRRQLIESREGFDTEEEKREYLSPPLSAPGHCAIVLFSWPQIRQAIYLPRE